MSSKYVVINSTAICIRMFDAHSDAVEYAKLDAKERGLPRYVYKLVADVVVETRTVVEVIEHEQ